MDMDKRTDIKSLDLDELRAKIEFFGEKPYRAKQLYEWFHVRLARDYDEMTNIPKSLKAKLSESCDYTSLKIARMQVSRQDGTRKYLFELADGNLIESVWMKYHHGNSVCISSQAGCRMGCRFCASTIGGLERNLTPSEMLDQIYAITRDTGERVSNVVVMGTGEPLDNYDNLLKFIRLLTDENGLHISQRNVTVSTCGLVEKIKSLADEHLQITLALSLHAATQEKRKKLMPVANQYEIDEVIAACRYYFEKTGRRVTFEYGLIGGENDTDADAADLCSLLGGFPCHVNLIPINPIKERSYRAPDRVAVTRFQEKLEKRRINTTVRREMGRDIDGACGQLRKRASQAGEIL